MLLKEICDDDDDDDARLQRTHQKYVHASIPNMNLISLDETGHLRTYKSTYVRTYFILIADHLEAGYEHLL